MRYSIGRKSKVKKSTGMDWEELRRYERKRRRYGRIRYSTGGESPVEHFTGTLTGNETDDEEPDEHRETWQSKARDLQAGTEPDPRRESRAHGRGRRGECGRAGRRPVSWA